METKMNPNDTEATETATAAGICDAAEFARTASTETGGRTRGRLVAGWHFTRHLLEMVVAMVTGMAALGASLWALGEPPGYANLFVRYGLMGAFMSAPMVAWMRYRGHAWSDGGEMTAAIPFPMYALVIPVELGLAGYVPGLSEDSLMVLSHRDDRGDDRPDGLPPESLRARVAPPPRVGEVVG
jgi:hypothetical protein